MRTMARPISARGSHSAFVAMHSPQTSVEKTEVSVVPKTTRASRLPTMPLQVTTRARKHSPSEGDSKGTTHRISSSPKTTKRVNHITTSENRHIIENGEPLKKKLRSSQTAATAQKQKTPEPGQTLNVNGNGDSNVNPKKDKPSRNQTTQSEQNGLPRDNCNAHRSSNFTSTTQDSSQTFEFGHPKKDEVTFSPFVTGVPRGTIREQYLKRSELVKKDASLEQLRMRQAQIAEQYRLMATLAKETNMVLIHKSIELLNKTHDAELAASSWVQNILEVLEQKELERFQQIEHKRKLDLIDARHEFNVMRNALYDSCDTRVVESRERHLCRIMEAVAEMKNKHDFDEISDDEVSLVHSASESPAMTPPPPNPPTGLDFLAFESSRQSHLPDPNETPEV